jgi:hypothetical protein
LLRGEWAFSHQTGAALCGLPLPSRLDPKRPLHVTVGAGTGTPVPQIDGVHGHEGLDRTQLLVLRNGLPVVQPMSTWCDLVPYLTDEDAVILGDAVLRRWGRPAQLDAVIAGRAGERGAVRMRRLRPLLRQRVDSPQETRTRLILRRAGLPEPECGRQVFAEDGGGWLATPDLSWPQVKVALEYDGEVHRRDRRQWRNDIARKQIMEDHGWRVLIATADDVFVRPRALTHRVASALSGRGLVW